MASPPGGPDGGGPDGGLVPGCGTSGLDGRVGCGAPGVFGTCPGGLAGAPGPDGGACPGGLDGPPGPIPVGGVGDVGVGFGGRSGGPLNGGRVTRSGSGTIGVGSGVSLSVRSADRRAPLRRDSGRCFGASGRASGAGRGRCGRTSCPPKRSLISWTRR
ncbi:hypothetical protein AB0L25_17245 [Spirillospora sp. NPDC052242]